MTSITLTSVQTHLVLTPATGAALTLTAQTSPLLELSADGVQGPPGPSGGTFSYVQSVASDTWVVNHNLGFKPNVSVLSPGGVEIGAGVTHTSNNQTVITLVIPMTGSVTCS